MVLENHFGHVSSNVDTSCTQNTVGQWRVVPDQHARGYVRKEENVESPHNVWQLEDISESLWIADENEPQESNAGAGVHVGSQATKRNNLVGNAKC